MKDLISYKKSVLFFLLLVYLVGCLSGTFFAGAESLSYINLIINDEKFLPGDTLSVKAYVYGMPLGEDFELKILDSWGNAVLNEFFTIETTAKYTFESDAPIGDWEILAFYGNLSTKRIISVSSKTDISIVVVGNKMIIRNIGNTPYDKTLNISFINQKGRLEAKNIELSLDINEEKEFQLNAKSGIYDIVVDGKRFNSIHLTGNVVSAVQLTEKPGFLRQYPVTAFIIFVVLLVFIVLLTVNLKDISFMVSNRKEDYIEIPKKLANDSSSIDLQKKGSRQSAPLFYNSKQAEHIPVINGQKQGSSILVVNTKNLSQLRDKLERPVFDALQKFIYDNATADIEENRGIVKKISDYSLMGIFAPSTRQFKHEMAVVKTALNINRSLGEYNRKLKNKLEFGIGVNTGELLIKNEGIMQYTALGNTIALAKKLADMSKNEIYASANLYSKVSVEVQGSNVGKVSTINGDIAVYSLTGIGSREAYKSYLSDILKRIK